jgi:hypothetical protein
MPNLRIRRVVTEFHPLDKAENGQTIGQMVDAKLDELIALASEQGGVNGPNGMDVMDVSLFFDPDSPDWPQYMEARKASGMLPKTKRKPKGYDYAEPVGEY